MSRREKRFIGGLLLGMFMTACSIVVRPVVLYASEDCRTGYCDSSWGTWHPYYWYFECYLPPCPDPQ